jgi:hypothetical protein
MTNNYPAILKAGLKNGWVVGSIHMAQRVIVKTVMSLLTPSKLENILISWAVTIISSSRVVLVPHEENKTTRYTEVMTVHLSVA